MRFWASSLFRAVSFASLSAEASFWNTSVPRFMAAPSTPETSPRATSAESSSTASLISVSRVVTSDCEVMPESMVSRLLISSFSSVMWFILSSAASVFMAAASSAPPATSRPSSAVTLTNCLSAVSSVSLRTAMPEAWALSETDTLVTGAVTAFSRVLFKSQAPI